MKFDILTEEEVKKLQFSSRSRTSQYQPILHAVADGKSVRIPVAGAIKPKTLSQRLYTAAKNAGLKVSVRILADESGVVVSKAEPKPDKPSSV